MGSLFKQKALPAPPPVPPTYVRDEINNVEQVPVTNPDGSVTYVTRKIPLTAEQQARADEIQGILDESLSEITRLSSGGYKADAATQKSLDAWAAVRKEVLADDLADRARVEEKTLARRGLGDSSAADDVRRRRRLDNQDALVNVAREQDALADELRMTDIGLQQNLYNIASSQQDATLAREAKAAAQGQSLLAKSNTVRQASLLDYYNAQLQRAQQPSTFTVFANAFGRAAGTALGGGF